MLLASFRRSPVARVSFCRSLPARSTKLNLGTQGTERTGAVPQCRVQSVGVVWAAQPTPQNTTTHCATPLPLPPCAHSSAGPGAGDCLPRCAGPCHAVDRIPRLQHNGEHAVGPRRLAVHGCGAHAAVASTSAHDAVGLLHGRDHLLREVVYVHAAVQALPQVQAAAAAARHVQQVKNLFVVDFQESALAQVLQAGARLVGEGVEER